MAEYTQAQIQSSILLSIKKAIGASPDYTPFDVDIIMHINSQLANLYQIGLNATKSVIVDGPDQLWTDLIPAGDSRLQFVKTYVYAKVKMIFDPPISTAQMQALKDAASESEFRISVAVDKPYDDLNPIKPDTPSGGTNDHCKLINRDQPDQHPIGAITDLSKELSQKLSGDNAMSNAQIDNIVNKVATQREKARRPVI